jgi:hypothetical protein
MSKRVTELEWMILTMSVGGLNIYVRVLTISALPLSNLEVC